MIIKIITLFLFESLVGSKNVVRFGSDENIFPDTLKQRIEYINLML